MAIKKATTLDDLKQEAAPVAEGYTVVIGPAGIDSTVPNSILGALLDSGYKKK